MREIKFRAWHEGCGEMIPNENQGFEGDAFNWLHEGQPIKIMQYTGLKDKNGKEIYEGDIILTPYDRNQYFGDGDSDTGLFKGEVHYQASKGFVLKRVLKQEHDSDSMEWKKHKQLDQIVQYKSEVIGSIYENPELLDANSNT